MEYVCLRLTVRAFYLSSVCRARGEPGNPYYNGQPGGSDFQKIAAAIVHVISLPSMPYINLRAA